MPTSKKNAHVDLYLTHAKTWRKEMEQLRKMLLRSPLTEEFKWDKPCYTYQKSNVILLLPLKAHCALLLCQGALLEDPAKILIQPTANTQAARQIRFTHLYEIERLKTTLQAYIHQAIAIEKAGLLVTYKKISEHPIPAELQKKLQHDPAFKTAFQALTPGRQRGYLLHISAAKQPQTRHTRIEKCTPQILAGKGLHDR